jgi:hypothetical protein
MHGKALNRSEKDAKLTFHIKCCAPFRTLSILLAIERFAKREKNTLIYPTDARESTTGSLPYNFTKTTPNIDEIIKQIINIIVGF